MRWPTGKTAGPSTGCATNNPAGHLIPGAVLAPFLAQVPAHTRVWVDEAYIDYAGSGESGGRIAAKGGNVVVCKSLSKVYALSGPPPVRPVLGQLHALLSSLGSAPAPKDKGAGPIPGTL